MLDINQKPEVQYAVPNWLRDEQIKLAIKRVKGRIEPHSEPRTEPIAVVGFGPSLKGTWEKIKDFKFVMSCSGSHKFLLDRGIVPNWHIEVDPRAHKVELIGPPHKDVEYLIASACHPKVFDHLEGYNVKLWHVFGAAETGVILPPGDWAITGGCDVGLRALTIARFFGFVNLQVFGMDGSAPQGTGRHADKHPHGDKQKLKECPYKGETYYTTEGMLAAAQQIWHELDQMPDVNVTFHGDGLIQTMAKDYVRKEPKGATFIAALNPILISSEYRELNAQLHRENLAYGVGGAKHADTIAKMVENTKAKSVLDYGCGKGYLAKSLPYPIWEYDPAIPGKDETPRPADLVVCTDVLEHIEPDKLTLVLADLARCTKQVAYFTINTAAASKVLPNGKNTHLIQEKQEWWESKLGEFFKIAKVITEGKNILHVIVSPHKVIIKKAA
jgi:uncharacterized Rossmann fold enzyme